METIDGGRNVDGSFEILVNSIMLQKIIVFKLSFHLDDYFSLQK